MAEVSSFDAASFLLEMTIKSAGIVSIAWLMTALWRSSAALRHALWLAAFFALLLLPAFSILLPPLSFVSGLSGIFEGAVSLYDGAAAVKSPPGLSPVPSQINSDPPAPPLAGKLDGILASSHSGIGSSRLYPFLLGLWLAGLIASLSGLVLDYRSRRRWLADARCVTSGLWADIAAELERNGLVRRPIRILVSPRIPVPVTWGFIRPAVAIPLSAQTWPADRIRTALLHEVAHARRGDQTTQLFARIITAFYWFHPMVWHAFRCLRLEQEKACDDFVLNAGQRSSSYGRHLMEIAMNAMNARHLNSTASLPIVQSSSLVARIRALVDEQSDRRPVQRHQMLRVGVLIGCVSCLIATLSLADETRYAETADKASLRPAAEQAEAMTVADDGSVRFTLDRFEVSLRPMTAEELNRQFPARGAFLSSSTVFRLGVRNYYYPKVFIDPASIVMQSPDGRKWHNLAPAYFAPVPSPGRDRNELLREALFPADAVFSGQEKSGYVLFTGLDPDVRDIQVTVKDAVLRYDYRGKPVQTVDFTYRFER